MSFFDFTDPTQNGPLLGMLQGLGQAAMPSRLPVPFGAVLGQAAGGYAQGQQQNLANRKSQLELSTGNLGLAQALTQLDAQMRLGGHPNGIQDVARQYGIQLPMPTQSGQQGAPQAPAAPSVSSPFGTRMDALKAAGGGDINAGAANLGTGQADQNPLLQATGDSGTPGFVAAKGRVASGLPPGIPQDIWDAMDATSRSQALAKFAEPQNVRPGSAQAYYDFGSKTWKEGFREPDFSTTPTAANNPTTGKPDQFILDRNGDMKWIGLQKPGERYLTADEVAAKGYPAGSVVTVDANNNYKTQYEPAKPQAAASPERFKQEMDLAKYNQTLRTGADLSPDDPNVVHFAHEILGGNFTAQQVPAQYRTAVAAWLDNQPAQAYSPIASNRFARAAEAVRTQYLKQPGYELAANGLPYVLRIDAAMQKPGSVSDQDLLDSFTKLNTAGNAITDAQVKVITDGKSLSDWAGTIANKFKNGGILSQNQRQQIYDLSHAVYSKYLTQYAPVMDQVTTALQGTGIPKAFWGIPDVKAIADRALAPDQGTGQQGANNLDLSPSNLSAAALKRGITVDALKQQLRAKGYQVP